jgi:hypothetical protein
MKALFARNRPDVLEPLSSFSFPSGHKFQQPSRCFTGVLSCDGNHAHAPDLAVTGQRAGGRNSGFAGVF